MIEHRKILDDLFNVFTMIGRGNYVTVYDVKGNVTRFSPEAVKAFGLSGEYIPSGDIDWGIYIHPEDKSLYKKTMQDLLGGDIEGYDVTYRTRLKDGTYAMMRHIGSTIFDAEGKPELIGGIVINEGLIESTDPATLLRNQYGFFRDLIAAIELNKHCVVIMCGINKMSTINAENGYAFGNAVLQQVGWLIQEVVGSEGTVYRMEGAKFAFLTETLSPEEVAAKYEKIRRAALAGLPVNNVRKAMTLSGGMVQFDGGSYDERTINACMTFTYNESKFYHNGKLVNYNGAIGRSAHESLELVADVRDDILMDCKNFSLRYQPVFNAETEQLTAIEALLCWHSERFGEVPPSAYVPVLERDFLFEELGYWILRHAMEDGLKVLSRKPDLILNVNISPAQIVDDLLFTEIDKLAKTVGFSLNNLCFELTQSCRLIEPDILRRIVRDLKAKGILCLIDDFGSGVASIDFLRDLAPNFIKLERDYILNIKDNDNWHIVRHLSELATELGTKVCLKGIEDADIREAVRSFPAINVQGNYYSKSITLDEIISRYL